MGIKKHWVGFAAASLICISALGQAQSATPLAAWAPVPVKPAPFTGPNKPHKKFTDIIATALGVNDSFESARLAK